MKKSIEQIKTELFHAMEKAEIACSARKVAELNVPEWKVENEARAEVGRLYKEFSSFPDEERKRVLGMK